MIFLTTMKNLQYILEKMKCWAMFIKIVPFNSDRGQHSTIESKYGFKISATSFLSLKQTSSTSESYRKIIRSDSEQEMKEEINKLHKYLGCIHLLNTRKYCDNTRKYCGNTHEYWPDTWKMCSPAGAIFASFVTILVSFEAILMYFKACGRALLWN